MSEYSKDLMLALELADAADKASLPRFKALDLKVETKPDLSPVTDADRSVELAIKEILERERPQDGIIGEEYGASGSDSRKWIIDPIDGTANFLRGVPIWASLIALSIDGHPKVSVVSAPAMGLRWWADESGSYAKGIDGTVRKLSVSDVSKLEDASLNYNNLQLWLQTPYFESLIKLAKKVWRTRAFGDFWSYMLVAEGAVDVVAEHGLKLYDIAALVPIVERAGGTFTAFDGPLTESSSSVIASNSVLHKSIVDFFADSN